MNLVKVTEARRLLVEAQTTARRAVTLMEEAGAPPQLLGRIDLSVTGVNHAIEVTDWVLGRADG